MELEKHFAALEVSTRVETLEFGDFAFEGNGPDGRIRVGIERKVIPDLMQSLQSGRFTGHQLPGLLHKFDRVYLVIEGPFRMGPGTGLLEVPRGVGYRPLVSGRPVQYQDMGRFITSLQECGVRVAHTRSQYETAYLIGRVLEPWWSKDYDQHTSFQTIYRPGPAAMQLVKIDKTEERLRRVAMDLADGIGWTRSKAIAETFGSIRAMVNAESTAWGEIEGIGKKLQGEVEKNLDAAVPSRRVPKSHQTDRNHDRHSQRRQDEQLDAGQHAQRRVSKSRGDS